MITACGYTSKFNQTTLGSSSTGAVAAVASSCWGPWGSSQAAGPTPNPCWCGSTDLGTPGSWTETSLVGFTHRLWLVERRSGFLQPPASPRWGKQGPCPEHPLHPTVLSCPPEALEHKTHPCPPAGMAVLRLRQLPANGNSSEHLNITNQDPESQAAFKTQAVQEATIALGFIVRL